MKLEGEAKVKHRQDLLQRLVHYDPVMGAAMTVSDHYVYVEQDYIYCLFYYHDIP